VDSNGAALRSSGALSLAMRGSPELRGRRWRGAGKPQSWRQADPPGACFADYADRVANKADHATSVLFFAEQARVVFVLSGRRNRFKISEAERVHGALELPDH